MIIIHTLSNSAYLNSKLTFCLEMNSKPKGVQQSRFKFAFEKDIETCITFCNATQQ